MAASLAFALGAYTAFLIVAYFLHRFGIERHHVESAWFWLAAALLSYAVVAARRDPPEDVAVLTARVRALVMLVPLLLAWIVYWPSVGLGLLSDDFVLLQRAASGYFWTTQNEFLRPLPLLVWYALKRRHTPRRRCTR